MVGKHYGKRRAAGQRAGGQPGDYDRQCDYRAVGDARFGEGAWRDKADGYSFTLYRGADGERVQEMVPTGY